MLFSNFRKNINSHPQWTIIRHFLIMMAIFSLCRIVFYLANTSYFPEMDLSHFFHLMTGGLRFDLTALIYGNLLFIVLLSIPFKFRTNETYQGIVRWVFIVINSLLIIANCVDIPFFRFTNRRTTNTIFSEFKHENNLFKIISESVFHYWYITLFAIVLIFLLFKLYKTTSKPSVQKSTLKSNIVYYTIHTILLAFIAYSVFIGARGGFGRYTRPITLSNANEYVNKTNEAAIVLNTPFCIIRTINVQVYKNPHYFTGEEQLKQVFSPIHEGEKKEQFKPLNVVVLIIESFGKEYTGFFNKSMEKGKYKGYTPFVDSLLNISLTSDYSYSNGRKSIDAMPSVLSSIPMFIEPYFLTPYSSNNVMSLASLLKTKGYYSAFFHGAPNGSLGFQAYARAVGFDDYFGMSEYPNKKDFDGVWAIWDEEFLQFFANKMGQMKQPFITSVFTATSHHPFQIPERYKGKFPLGTLPIHQCIGYTDMALRRFFHTMSKYPWYKNTLFVLTADHTNQSDHALYKSDENLFSIPILFYHPGSNLSGRLTKPIDQIDIMPTILGYLHYDKPYVAFGQDILNTNSKNKYVINYSNQIYQLYTDNYLLQFDGQNIKAIYQYKSDPFLTKKIEPSSKDSLTNFTKAIIQQYITRMLQNQLTPSN